MRTNNIRLILFIISGIIIIVMAWSALSSSRENRRLHKIINKNISLIDQFEKEKDALLSEIKKDSLLILEKDIFIKSINKSVDSLIDKIKNVKNDKYREKYNYANSDIVDRVVIFSKIASEAD